jgi:hypothetical protein
MGRVGEGYKLRVGSVQPERSMCPRILVLMQMQVRLAKRSKGMTLRTVPILCPSASLELEVQEVAIADRPEK